MKSALIELGSGPQPPGNVPQLAGALDVLFGVNKDLRRRARRAAVDRRAAWPDSSEESEAEESEAGDSEAETEADGEEASSEEVIRTPLPPPLVATPSPHRPRRTGGR